MLEMLKSNLGAEKTIIGPEVFQNRLKELLNNPQNLEHVLDALEMGGPLELVNIRDGLISDILSEKLTQIVEYPKKVDVVDSPGAKTGNAIAQAKVDIHFTKHPEDVMAKGEQFNIKIMTGNETYILDQFKSGGPIDIQTIGNQDKSVIFVSQDFKNLTISEQRDIRARMRENGVVIAADLPLSSEMGNCFIKATENVIEGYKEFGSKVQEDLLNWGLKVFTQLTQGKGENSHVKPGDWIAYDKKNKEIIVGENKSGKELDGGIPSGAGMMNDPLKDYRQEARDRAKLPESDPRHLDKSIGKHLVHLAQAEYNAENVRKGICNTKEGLNIEGMNIRVGYSIPKSEASFAEKTLADKGITDYKKIEGKQGTVTYVYKQQTSS